MTPLLRHRWLAAGGALLTLPLFLVTLLVLLSMVNTMGLVFLTRFTIENHTDRELWVTPIGAVGPEGTRRTLPLAYFTFPYLLSLKDREFRLGPGARRDFTYDWDDIQFSEILVRDQAGDLRVLPTGLPPTEGQYRRPEQKHFVVRDWPAMSLPSPEQRAAMDHPRNRRVLGLYLLGLGGLAFPWFVVKALRGSSR